ncbi:hypothetical protein GLYMA_10G000351v4 [Glycine max]|nr:hypothetical protein GLYMA_10G000351v4 [Glycine max]KAH1136020.1 hypothetical protein GYH30_026482 [Glycine max]
MLPFLLTLFNSIFLSFCLDTNLLVLHSRHCFLKKILISCSHILV